jgi:hypothetical protein
MARLSVRELASRKFTNMFLWDINDPLTLVKCSALVSSDEDMLPDLGDMNEDSGFRTMSLYPIFTLVVHLNYIVPTAYLLSFTINYQHCRSLYWPEDKSE